MDGIGEVEGVVRWMLLVRWLILVRWMDRVEVEVVATFFCGAEMGRMVRSTY